MGAEVGSAVTWLHDRFGVRHDRHHLTVKRVSPPRPARQPSAAPEPAEVETSDLWESTTRSGSRNT